MSQESPSTLSNNHRRRMQGWARSVHPDDWQDRCAIVVEYCAQLEDDAREKLLRQAWPDVFAAVENAWPEAFASWKNASESPR